MEETLKLGAAIKKVRKAKKISQKELCAVIGVSRSYLSLIETNQRLPSMEHFGKIAEGLDMPVQILFWVSMNEDGIDEDKRELFRILKPSVDNILKEFLSDANIIREVFTKQVG